MLAKIDQNKDIITLYLLVPKANSHLHIQHLLIGCTDIERFPLLFWETTRLENRKEYVGVMRSTRLDGL